jgi:hypothetical protein
MKNISGQYQDLLEGKMNQAQFLRNARMMFPSFVTNHNSFDDSVKILKQKGMLVEGDAVKGTPDKEPTYESPTPDAKTKYKKVEQSPEVDEQDGIYPATTLTDIPKVKTTKRVKNESDGLEPIKDNDTKNEMKKVKVVKEGIHDRDITSAPHTNVKTPSKGQGDYNPKERAANLSKLRNFGPKTENIAPEEIETAEVEINTNDSSIQAMADKMGISQEELFKLLLKKLGGLKENQMNKTKMSPDAKAVTDLITRQPMILQKLSLINNKEELQSVFDFLLSKINQTYSKSTSQIRTATNQTLSNREKIAPKLEGLITRLMNETLSKKSAI